MRARMLQRAQLLQDNAGSRCFQPLTGEQPLPAVGNGRALGRALGQLPTHNVC